jgi:hypothetical protein
VEDVINPLRGLVRGVSQAAERAAPAAHASTKFSSISL